MQALESMFSHRVCINLDRRPDRWGKCSSEFARHGLCVSRIPARDGQELRVPSTWRYGPGAYGCALSHLDAVSEARDRGYRSVLVFEDDVELHEEFVSLFEQFASELPTDWDAAFLGGIHREDPLPVSPHVSRIVSSNSTFAYALNHTIYDAWLERNRQFTAPVDEVNKTLQRDFAFYCSVPPLAWVTEGYSDILGAEVNHWWIREGLTIDGCLSRDTISRTGVLVLPPGGSAPAQEVTACMLDRLRRIFPEVVTASDRYEDDWIRNRGVELLSDKHEYWIVTDADLYVPTWELKASLLKCRDADMVVPLHEPIRLTAADTARAMNGDLGPVDTTPYARVPLQPGFDGFAIIRTASLARLRDSASLRIFHSPSRVWRLSL
jgi:glycosyl transferase family 25